MHGGMADGYFVFSWFFENSPLPDGSSVCSYILVV